MKNRALVLGLLAALPALAQDGFKVGLNLGFMKPTIDQGMSIGGYYTTGAPGSIGLPNKLVFTEYGSQMPVTLDLGLRKGENDFTLSIQAGSKKNTDSYEDPAGGLYSFSGWTNFDTFMTAETNFKNLVVDLAWTRTVAKVGEGSFNLSTGLRYGSYENKATLRGYDNPDDPAAYWDVYEFRGKTTAYGLTFGLGYSYPLTTNLLLGARFNLGYLQGKTDSGYNRYYDPDYNSSTYRYEAEMKSKLFTQTDLAVNLTWKVTKAFEATLGYRATNFGPVGNTAEYWMMRGDMGMSGFQLGAAFTF